MLKDIRVLDLTHFIAGPFCCQILGDNGAEVIKIEPLEGEYSRNANPMMEDTSLYFSAFNRNKKSIALDLKSPKGIEVLHDLIETSDVVVTNYGPNVPEKLGFDYETISKINPKIIMTHITGFGMTGPFKNKSAFDGIIQAMSGIVHLTGEADEAPTKVGIYIADHMAGIQGVLGTLLALHARTQTNKGQLVDISMLDSMASLLSYNLADVTALGNSPHRAGNDSTNVFATTFKTKDSYLYIAPLTDRMWHDFSQIIGQEAWSSEDSPYLDVNNRLKDYDYLKTEIEKWTQTKSGEEVLALLESKGIACAKVNSIGEVLENPQLKARDMLQKLDLENSMKKDVIMPGNPIKLSDQATSAMENPPKLGEHAQELLTELNYSEEEIQALITERVVYKN